MTDIADILSRFRVCVDAHRPADMIGGWFLPGDLSAILAHIDAQAARDADRITRERTHAETCWTWGHAHYDCALARITALEGALAKCITAKDVLELQIARGHARALLTQETHNAN